MAIFTSMCEDASAGEPIEGLRSLLDVSPTVLEWLGLELQVRSAVLRRQMKSNALEL
eukprot:SAG11_NODE_3820_length_2209_cov_1.796209_3_plen_57_part_00